MKILTKLITAIILFFLIACQTKNQEKTDVLSLHPENPNYFEYKGKPTILVTSGEHYGAVMNADFDIIKYLLTLKKDGLNYTRIFLGPYSELGDNTFGIPNNTMNPKSERWLTPWLKHTEPGK